MNPKRRGRVIGLEVAVGGVVGAFLGAYTVMDWGRP